jgi:hypothetical protein
MFRRSEIFSGGDGGGKIVLSGEMRTPKIDLRRYITHHYRLDCQLGKVWK